MKRIILIICILLPSILYAQKSYVNVLVTFNPSYETTNFTIWLTGDIPSDMKEYYRYNESKIGEILNRLSANGYEVEYMCDMAPSGSGYRGMNYLLSKKTSGSANAIQKINITDEDVVEVARYNLQGLPVNENEKGIQIIVYSNYTTKTVIVQ